MKKCGLLGEKLSHSYSPTIHNLLGSYEYRLYERSPEQLEEFLTKEPWDGLNVTIPYKKTVVPYCQELSPTAKRLGSVNTLVRRSDGTLYGDNTDAFGFGYMIEQSGVEVAGKKALVLGSGGASVTVCAVLEEKQAAQVIVVSRSGENNYENLSRHADAQIIVNTTPVGMYPSNGSAPLDLTQFPNCQCVLDIVYNPARTALLLQAESLKIPNVGGLSMLVAQAKRSSEQFTGNTIPPTEIARIVEILSKSMQNIVLIGMPGCGKSTIAKLLATNLGRSVKDADQMVEDAVGMSIPSMFEQHGEAFFRQKETEILSELGKQSGIIISTGGGCVTRLENYPLLHQNGIIFWLQRDVSGLAKKGRPISMSTDLNTLYQQRKPLYEAFADYVINNDQSFYNAVEQILEVIS